MHKGENSEEQPLISVIVPIYNIENYVEECVDSIIGQTYHNLEIILVDDGSTDSSGKICDEYLQKDARVKVIHKENGGLSDARNVGISKASGALITLVDGDDCIDKEMIKVLHKNMRAAQADIATCAYDVFYSQRPSLKSKKNAAAITYNANGAIKDALYQKKIGFAAWAKLYRAELFRSIEYPKGKLYEDLATTYKLYGISKKIAFCELPLYFYRKRPGSIMQSNFSATRLQTIEYCKDIVKYMSKNYPDCLQAAYNRSFAEGIFILEAIPLFANRQERRKVFKELIKKNRSKVIAQNESKKRLRAYALVSFFGSFPLSFAIKIKILLYNHLKMRVVSCQNSKSMV